MTPEEVEAELVARRLPGRAQRPAARPTGGSISLPDFLDIVASGSFGPATARVEKLLDGVPPEKLAAELERRHPGLGPAIARWWERSRTAPATAAHEPGSPWTWGGRAGSLQSLLGAAASWSGDVDWFVRWSAHIGRGYRSVAAVVAAEVEAGRADLAAELRAQLAHDHPVSGPSEIAVHALLATSEPENWAAVAASLADAGRQPGVLETVLDALWAAHSGAHAVALQALVDTGHARSVPVLEVVGRWLGEEVTTPQSPQVERFVEVRARTELIGRDARPGDVDAATAVEHAGFLAGVARWDEEAAVPHAVELLSYADPALRLAGAHWLLRRNRTSELLSTISDPDQAVAATAVAAAAWRTVPGGIDGDVRTALLERVRDWPRTLPVQVGVVGHHTLEAGSALAADALLRQDAAGGKRSQVWRTASPRGRAREVSRLGEDPAAHRDALVVHVADRSADVRRAALEQLVKLDPITDAEVAAVRAALVKHRLGRVPPFLDVTLKLLVTVLSHQDDDNRRATLSDLAGGSPVERRAAVQLAEMCGLPDPTRSSATDAPEPLAGVQYTPADRTPAIRPSGPPPGRFAGYHATCRYVVTSLLDHLIARADDEVTLGNEVRLVQNLHTLPWAREGAPVAEFLTTWWADVQSRLTDGGIELQILSVALVHGSDRMGKDADWFREVAGQLTGPLPELAEAPRWARALVPGQMQTLAHHLRRPSWTPLYLDVISTVLAELPVDAIRNPEHRHGGGGPVDPRPHLGVTPRPQAWGIAGRDDLARWWALVRFLDEPDGITDPWSADRALRRHRVEPRVVASLFDLGLATRADVLDAVIAPDRGRPVRPHRDFGEFTASPSPDWVSSPVLQAVVADIRRSAVDSQVSDTAEMGNVLTPLAWSLGATVGVESLLSVLAATVPRPLVRSPRNESGRDAVLSHLLTVHVPAEDDTPADLERRLQTAAVPPQRAVELAMLAPQWAPWIEATLHRPGLASGVLWVHAHRRVEEYDNGPWRPEMADHTRLTQAALTAGEVDFGWWASFAAQLGSEGVASLLAAAPLASRATQHHRTRLYARALSASDEDGSAAALEIELISRVQDKRDQDAARALGLLPLTGPDDPRLLTRWRAMQVLAAPERTAKAQKRKSEAEALLVGLTNLARRAGYPDATRLTWTMEAETLGDLRDGPVIARSGDVEVELGIDAEGSPAVSVRRGTKTLARVPASAKRDPAVAELMARAGDLRDQAIRMRRWLERACTDREEITGAELPALVGHPVLGPMLRALVLVDDTGAVGFPDLDAGGLRGVDGSVQAWTGRVLRIAHPVDLATSGDWPALQRSVFADRNRQPFRQLFRELYVPTDAELGHRDVMRFAGRRVVRRRGAALLGAQGWRDLHEPGAHVREFPAAGVTVYCYGLSTVDDHGSGDVTTGHLEFVGPSADGRVRRLPAGEIPPVVFSEAMRDMDLVVSVAAASGVEVETSEASLAVRRQLVEETMRASGVEGVEVRGHHAVVQGRRGRYSVHLGSGTVHKLPGRSIVLVPVPDDHLGRVFLPFVDDDPTVALILSEVLLLAEDDRVSDPVIVRQLG